MNLNPGTRQCHQVRVITVGFFRMLKSMQTYRVVKTKTENSALNEFIDWLEVRYREDEGSEGIVMIFHEQRKLISRISKAIWLIDHFYRIGGHSFYKIIVVVHSKKVTTVPEPQPCSRPTTEAEREQMCLTLCDLASPITCKISELDEQENILVRQNSLRPVFLQYFKTTIYHR